MTIILTAIIVAPSFTILGFVAGLWWAHVREEARITEGFRHRGSMARHGKPCPPLPDAGALIRIGEYQS